MDFQPFKPKNLNHATKFKKLPEINEDAGIESDYKENNYKKPLLEISDQEKINLKIINKNVRVNSDSGHDSFMEENEEVNLNKPKRSRKISNSCSDCSRNSNLLSAGVNSLPRSPSPTESVEHILASEWKMYCRINKSKNTDWASFETTELAVINSVETFWKVLNHLAAPSKMKRRIGPNLMLFRNDIQPTWEDENNKNGGMWGIILKESKHRGSFLDQLWMESLLACIGETLTFGEKINGVIIQRRQKEDRIQLWTTDADQADVQYSIGQHYKQLLNLDDSIELCYTKHADMKHITTTISTFDNQFILSNSTRANGFNKVVEQEASKSLNSKAKTYSGLLDKIDRLRI